MPRDIDSTLLADMGSESWQPVILASFAFRSKIEYYWTGRGTISWSGMNFTGIGTLGKLGTVGGGPAEVAEPGTTVEASGLDADLLGETLTDVQVGGSVSIWLGSWQNGALHGTPYLLWQGGMGQPAIVPDPKKFSIMIELQTRLAQLNRATCRRYTAADQRRYYPDDSGFNFVEIQNDIALIWGAAS